MDAIKSHLVESVKAVAKEVSASLAYNSRGISEMFVTPGFIG